MRWHFMLILLLCANSILSKEICSVGNVDIDWYIHFSRFKLNASDRGIAVEEFEIQNVTDSYFDDSKYLEVIIEGNKMKIQLTDEFENYEKAESSLDISVKWHILCEADGKTEEFILDYVQSILEENKYDPEFFETKYHYEFYGDLKRDFLLTDVMPIKARDWDISTDYIGFVVSKNEEFYVGWNTVKNKIGTADLKTKTYIKAPFENNYTIETRDNLFGEYRSSSVPLTVVVKRSDETMEFEKTEYVAQLIGDKELEFEEEITLKNGLDHDTEVKIRSDYIDYFAVSIDMLRYTINVKLTKPLPLLISRQYSQIELFLDAHWRGLVATTTVAVRSDETIKKLCYVYGLDLDAKKNNGGWIKDNHTGIITTYNTLNVEDVTCSGTGSKYISCKFENNSLVLSVTDEFGMYEENESSHYIYLNMSITCPYNEVFTPEYEQYVDDINNHDPIFDSAKYNFIFYNQLPPDFALTDVMSIMVSDMDIDGDGFHLEVEREEGDYENRYLRASIDSYYQEKAAFCSFRIKQDMPPGFEKDFVVTVKDYYFDGYHSSKAIISIKVIKDQDQLKFKHSEVNSIIKNNIIIDSIELDNGLDYDTKFNIRSEYADYFEVVKYVLQNKIEIHATKDLSPIKEEVVRIIVEGEWHGVADSVTVYLYMNGELPTTVSSTEKPSWSSTEAGPLPDRPHEMEGFKVWTRTINVTQIALFSVAGITLCGMAFVGWRHYY